MTRAQDAKLVERSTELDEDHPLALALAAREQADRAIRAAALQRWRGLDGERHTAA